MEDAPILLIFLIIYLITASSGNKKKKKKRPLREGERRRQGTMRTEAQGEQMDWRSILRTEQANEGFYEAFDAHQQSELCDDQPIHLHEVSQAQMVQAGEGKDPCHAGGYTHGGEPEQEVSAQEDEPKPAWTEDVLRGVIMSEILTRPHERAALNAARRQNRQGYHG